MKRGEGVVSGADLDALFGGGRGGGGERGRHRPESGSGGRGRDGNVGV